MGPLLALSGCKGRLAFAGTFTMAACGDSPHVGVQEQACFCSDIHRPIMWGMHQLLRWWMLIHIPACSLKPDKAIGDPHGCLREGGNSKQVCILNIQLHADICAAKITIQALQLKTALFHPMCPLDFYRKHEQTAFCCAFTAEPAAMLYIHTMQFLQCVMRCPNPCTHPNHTVGQS